MPIEHASHRHHRILIRRRSLTPVLYTQVMTRPLTPRSRRLCRISMWLCLALCLATSVAWIASARWTMFFMAQFGDSVSLRAGAVSYLWTSTPLRERLAARHKEPLELDWQWYRSPRQIPMEWWTPFYSSTPTGRAIIALPLWIPFILFSGAGGAFYWLTRRMPAPGCCHRCGYCLSGLAPSRPCPECASKQSLASLIIGRVQRLAINRHRFPTQFSPQSIPTQPHTHS